MMELSYIMYVGMFIVLLDITLLCVYYRVCSMIYWTNKRWSLKPELVVTIYTVEPTATYTCVFLVYVCVCTCMCVYVCMHICLYMYVCVYIYMYIYDYRME